MAKSKVTPKVKVSKAIQTQKRMYLELLDELYRSYEHFNHYFNLELPDIVINFAHPGKKNVWGWMSADSWTIDESDTKTHEIRVHPLRFKTDGIEGVLETMLHEMAHVSNKVRCIKDCTPQQRHNGHFKRAAEALGLTVTNTGRLGFSHTELGEKALQAIKALRPDKAKYKLCLTLADPSEDKGKKPPKTTSVSIDKDVKHLIDAGVELDKDSDTTKDFLENAVKFYLRYLNNEFEIVEKK